MTAQVGDVLTLHGSESPLFTNPLCDYFEQMKWRPKFKWAHTANWRSYVASWELHNDRLYLIGIDAEFESGQQVTLNDIFPGFPDRVFAHWFTGILRIPQGEMVSYVHAGYAREFEEDLLIYIDRGFLEKQASRRNRLEA